MPCRPSVIALSTLLCAMASTRAASPPSPHVLHPAVTGDSARLMAFGARSAEQRAGGATDKLDATLSDLAAHIARVRPEHALRDLHTLNPAARFRQPAGTSTALVSIDAITRGDPEQLKSALMRLGLQDPAVYSNDVGGWLPVNAIGAATLRPELHAMRAALSRPHVGAVSSEGDFAQGSAALRKSYSTLTGSGITVGVMSDSFNCYATYELPLSNVPASGLNGFAPNGFLADASEDMKTGDLPASVNVLEEADCLQYGAPDFLPFGDEGRAMLQIVHDVAPGAALAFYTAQNSEADFATGIGKLATAGAKVEADDIGYFDEPYFQDGILAQAIDAVEAKGVAYFSAAGNNARVSYENPAPSFATTATSGPNAGELLLNFNTGGGAAATSLPITIPALQPGEYVPVVVEWDQPYVTGAAQSGGATSRIDLCVTGGSGADQIMDLDGNSVACTGANALGSDAVQIMNIGNPASSPGNSAAQSLNLMIGLINGTPPPGRIKLALEGDGAPVTIDSFATLSSTLQGHPGAAGALGVGAAFFGFTPRCGTSPALLESFSSAGGAAILFNVNSDGSVTRLATPVTRMKPDLVGPDGANTTFFGYKLTDYGISYTATVTACDNDASYPNFFGTSGATPHLAGSAALLLQANPAIEPAQLYAALRSSAAAMGSPTPNFDSGYGFVQADRALTLLPPAAPTLSLSASSVALGASSTLTWNSINTTGCTASGDWSGSLAGSGSKRVTPSAMGTATYMLTCSNPSGSAKSSINLTVTAAPAPKSSSGGGGSGGGLLALLAVVAGGRWIRCRLTACPLC